MLSSRRQRGDTIIEVLLAVTVFSMLAIGALVVMNSGNATAQRALEISLVRHEIDSQAEIIRFVHSQYIAGTSPVATAMWEDMTATPGLTWGANGLDGDQCPDLATVAPSAGMFVVNPATTTLVVDPTRFSRAQVYSRVINDPSNVRVEGLWVQSFHEPASSGTPGYVDFYIRACWNTVGQTAPMTLGTIVRLYEP